MNPDRPQAQFTAMTNSSDADWAIIKAERGRTAGTLADKLIAEMRLHGGVYEGLPVDHLTHGLQTATRAERAGRSDEYVFCALLHDIGDRLAPLNHAAVSAAIVGRFVSEDLHWMVEHHGEFQGYYFFHKQGLDRNVRDKYLGHPYYDLTAEFCAEFDQTAFDPGYATLPLEHFEPLIREIVGRKTA